MTCCDQNTTTFVNQSVTTLPYNGEYGEHPLVEVVYLMGEEWIQQGVFTQIKIEPGQIVIDHGGPATGIIKLT